MTTFASEFVLEPLTGVRPNGLEVILLIFDAIGTGGVSLVIHMYLLFKTECRVDPPPHLPGGHPEGKQAQAAYWSSVWGHIAWMNDKIALTKSTWCHLHSTSVLSAK